MHLVSPLSRLACLLLAGAALPATAATLCVAASSAPGCYTRIADAVTAAAPGDLIQVAPGVYKESLLITKPLSLAGENAIIDATGLSRGIFVNGFTTPGLAAVHISGFTIRNADLEGILVLNATDVTVASNTVTGNNRALQPNGTCPALPAFEPGEQQDCGEGIHLQAADHSIVTNNIVTGNSGGILLSDDTGPLHDNLISNNTVSDNPYACGITMASHIPAAQLIAPGGPPAPFGVFHNTVFANRSLRNGLAVGGGAGFGIFASIPGAKAYGNIVVDNFASENGLPGIAMHAHAPNQSLNDNMLVGNTLTGNGKDTADANTSGPTGINLYSLTPVTGNIISGNAISNESIDVAVNAPALVQVEFNALLGLKVGIDNIGLGPIDASSNWWSCSTGPTTSGSCSSITGAKVLDTPWLTQPIPAIPTF